MLNINHIDRIGKSGLPVRDDYLIGTAYCSLFRQLAVRPKQPTGHTQTAHLSFGDKYQNIGDLSAKTAISKQKRNETSLKFGGLKNILPLHPQKDKIMNGLYTILLLVLSNIFMTLAWYGHLKLQQTGVSSNWPLIGVIAFSWAIAFFEYCCQVPANRIGFVDNGGPFNLVQLKVIQECVSLIVFAIIANILFQGQGLHWNHFAAFCCLIAAVYFVFMK